MWKPPGGWSGGQGWGMCGSWKDCGVPGPGKGPIPGAHPSPGPPRVHTRAQPCPGLQALLVGEGCPCPNSAWVLSRSSRQRACGASGWGAAPHGEGAQGWRPGVGAPEKEVSSQGRPPARGVASLPGQGARQSVDRPARRGVHQGVDRPAGRAVQDLRCTHRLPHPGFGCPGILTVGTRAGTRQRAGSLLQCKIENVY